MKPPSRLLRTKRSLGPTAPGTEPVAVSLNITVVSSGVRGGMRPFVGHVSGTSEGLADHLSELLVNLPSKYGPSLARV